MNKQKQLRNWRQWILPILWLLDAKIWDWKFWFSLVMDDGEISALKVQTICSIIISALEIVFAITLLLEIFFDNNIMKRAEFFETIILAGMTVSKWILSNSNLIVHIDYILASDMVLACSILLDFLSYLSTAILFLLWGITLKNSRCARVGKLGALIFGGLCILYKLVYFNYAYGRNLFELLKESHGLLVIVIVLDMLPTVAFFVFFDKEAMEIKDSTAEIKKLENEKGEGELSVMKYCSYCGKEIMSDAVICPHCGCPTQNYKAVQEQDAPSTGLNVLSFLIPLAGLIIYLMDKDRMPQRARAAGKWALIGVGVSVGLVVLYIILGAVFVATLY